jgi:hypothetical protein
MMPTETEAMRTLRLALEGTLRQQAETILTLHAQIDALRGELADERHRTLFWKQACASADADLSDLRRLMQARVAA